MRVREQNLAKGLVATLSVMALTVLSVLVVLPRTLGSITTRPEGAAFHFLYEGVGKDDAGFLDDFGDPGLAQRLRQFERHDDGDWFERVEVGRGVREGDRARVPALVVRRDQKAPKHRSTDSITAVVARTGDEWKVVDIEARAPGTLVPSEGGDQPARAPASAWFVAVAIGVALTALAELVLRRAPAPAPAAAG